MNSGDQKTLKTEMLKGEIEPIAVPEWWAVVPVGERKFLRELVRMMRSAKRSRSPEVAQAASKWAGTLGCFIKVRLVREKGKAEGRKRKSAATACPSGERSQPGAVPNQG
jgi:hypothetical protein